MVVSQVVRLAKSVLARVDHYRRARAKARWLATRPVYARFTIYLNRPEERAFQQRKLIGYLRMRGAGIRPASIRRYLQKGWPSVWARAYRKEVAALIDDIKLNSALNR